MNSMSHFDYTESDAKPTSQGEIVILEAQSLHETFVPPKAAEDSLQQEQEDQLLADLKKFLEPDDNIHDNREYQRSGSDPGLVVIFNQQKFDDESYKKRTGTNRDVNELILTFGRLGYNVQKQHIHVNLTRKEILQVLHNLSQEDHSHRNSLIIIVLTHGDKGDSLQARDAPLNTNEFWEPFTASNCRTLKDKPKFFIFQACKGQEFSQYNTISGEVIPTKVYTTPLESDMLVAFAAVEGSQSYRSIFNGTWFIQELCRNFSAFGRRDDVVSLLIRTTKCVANNYFHVPQKASYTEADCVTPVRKQMPLFVSTLTKKFYLTKSKDRSLLLQLLQQQQNITNILGDVQEKVNKMHSLFENKRNKGTVGQRF